MVEEKKHKNNNKAKTTEADEITVRTKKTDKQNKKNQKSNDTVNTSESKEIKEAKEEAARIVKQAEEYAREIHGASLEYVDEMLAEISLAAKRAKENIRIIMEQTLEDIDSKIDMIEANQKEILKDLHELSENGTRPVRRANYDIKVDESYIPKKAYDIRITDGQEERIESIRPAKQPFEIKIADEWKGRIEHMLDEQNNLYIEDTKPSKQEEADDDTEEGFNAADFDLDSEYFDWLNKK